MNRLFQNSTNNGRTGFALTSAAPNGSLRTVYNVTKGRKTVRPGMAKIGSGQQGVVFLASTDRAGKHQVIIKVSPSDKKYSATNQSARVEYNIQKALYKIVPKHIPKPIKFFAQDLYVPISEFTNRRPSVFNYTKQMIMFTEYAHGGTLKSWLRKMGSRVTDKVMADMIRQIISTLKRIHEKYPEFRHNDMHLGNVLVDDTGKKVRFMITDFGLSRLTQHGSNPVINSGNYRNSGISNSTSYKYDLHYFLNALDSEIRSGLPETKAFLDRMLPFSYRGANTNKVTSFRLRNGASNAGLPSFTAVLRDPFLSGKSLRRARASPASPNVSVGGIFNTNTPATNAADIASRALSNIPGVHVSGGARPSAANFMRMSPRSRAAFFTRDRNRNASRSVVVRDVARTRGANVVRETTRRVPTANVRRLPLGTGSRSTAAPGMYFLPSRPRRPSSAVRSSSSSSNTRSPLSRPRSVVRPLAEMTARERTGISRGMAAARRAARMESRARAGPRISPKQILNQYTNSLNNLRTLSRRALKAKLTQAGFSNTNANRHSRNWETNWIASRQSANNATRNLRAGKNLNKRGYAPFVFNAARRRVAENLSKGPNGRIRSGKALLSGKTKAQLVTMAQRHGITGANSMTKDMIIMALYG